MKFLQNYRERKAKRREEERKNQERRKVVQRAKNSFFLFVLVSACILADKYEDFHETFDQYWVLMLIWGLFTMFGFLMLDLLIEMVAVIFSILAVFLLGPIIGVFMLIMVLIFSNVLDLDII